MLALTAALAWPRAGGAVLLVPLGAGDVAKIVTWARREGAPLLELDTSRGRAIARIADNRGLFDALRSGILPVAARTTGCQAGARR